MRAVSSVLLYAARHDCLEDLCPRTENSWNTMPGKRLGNQRTQDPTMYPWRSQSIFVHLGFHTSFRVGIRVHGFHGTFQSSYLNLCFSPNTLLLLKLLLVNHILYPKYSLFLQCAPQTTTIHQAFRTKGTAKSMRM